MKRLLIGFVLLAFALTMFGSTVDARLFKERIVGGSDFLPTGTDSLAILVDSGWPDYFLSEKVITYGEFKTAAHVSEMGYKDEVATACNEIIFYFLADSVTTDSATIAEGHGIAEFADSLVVWMYGYCPYTDATPLCSTLVPIDTTYLPYVGIQSCYMVELTPVYVPYAFKLLVQVHDSTDQDTVLVKDAGVILRWIDDERQVDADDL